MKINNLIKAIPFLSVLFLIFYLYISNQKQYTKLRILIWDTPSLSLGTYLAMSTGSGFALSYVITTQLSKINDLKIRKSIKYKDENLYEEISEYKDTSFNTSYDNTLIERDIKDPSPTVEASFRVIGKTNKINNNHVHFADSSESEKDFYVQQDKNKINIQENQFLIDWNDESFLNW